MGSRTIVRVESAQEKSVADTRPTAKARTAADGGGTEAGRAAAEQRGSAPSTARTGAPKSWERKHIAVDTLSPRSQDGGVASDRTEALRLKSQNARTTKGMGDQMKKAEAAKTVPVKPQGKAAATAKIPIRESEARALTTTAAGSTRRRTKGATTALVPPKERARATPASAGSQSSTTQRSQSLKAANFKSEPRWDFEENYSLDVGGLQTVSFSATAALTPRALKPLLQTAHPTPPSPPRLHSSALPCPTLHGSRPILPSDNGRNGGGGVRLQNPGPGSPGSCE